MQDRIVCRTKWVVVDQIFDKQKYVVCVHLIDMLSITLLVTCNGYLPHKSICDYS